MTNENLHEANPHGELGLIALSSCKDFGAKIDYHLKEMRKRAGLECPDTFLIPIEEIRFTNGEGKTRLPSSVRGRDIFILCDPGNYSCTYNLYGYTNRKNPDEHFQDLKRALSAICGKSTRSAVVMPLMYASRQDKRKGRESLDCAMALRELERLGVKDIISFDLHDSRVQNAIPNGSLENLHSTYAIVKTLIQEEKDIVADRENLLIISPDSGGMDRAIYYASVLGTDVGMFYKRRDVSVVVNGKNPIIQHDYLGPSLKGKNVVITDDIIASGESTLDIACQVKKLGASKVFIAATFALFTEGCDKFIKYFSEGVISRVYSTNLTYAPEEIKNMQWYHDVDMSEYLAKIIDRLNNDLSIAPLIDSAGPLKEKLKELRNI